MSKKRVVICVASAFLILLAVGIGSFVTRHLYSQPSETTDRLLSLGEKYLAELNYEQALVQFLKVIEVEPMNPRGYTGAAEAYVGLGDTDRAIEILQQGQLNIPDDASIQILLDELYLPKTDDVDTTPAPSKEGQNLTDGVVVRSDFIASEYRYDFVWEQDWLGNDGAVGGCRLYATIDDADGIYNMLVGTWDENMTEEQVRENADYLLPIWKEQDSSGGEQDFTGISGQGFPIWADDFGKTVNVALIAFNNNYEYMGRVVFEVQIPANTSETTHSPSTATTNTIDNYEQIYAQYMASDQWHGEESEPLTITSHKFFDLDDNGIPELWFYAESDNMGPRGPERADFFCTVESETVKQLLSGYASGGTIGGDEITVMYDTERQIHVICKNGYAGGFGGRASWVEVYDYSDGILNKVTKYFQMSQTADNYTDSELNGIHYRDDVYSEIAIYEVNDERVSIEAYDEVAARFITATDEEYLLSY